MPTRPLPDLNHIALRPLPPGEDAAGKRGAHLPLTDTGWARDVRRIEEHSPRPIPRPERVEGAGGGGFVFASPMDEPTAIFG